MSSSLLKYYFVSLAALEFGEKNHLLGVNPVFSPNLPLQSVAAYVFQQAASGYEFNLYRL